MKQTSYNPDVLSCLANLSNDEVFTSPKLANEILDLLPKEIWKNKNATFLDPVCKSGVFLREIAKRLLEGLKEEIPNVKKRIEHIYGKQLFGIGITELTSLLSRRSLYCSKTANGKYSVLGSFDNEQGSIFFEKTKHDWQNGRCSFCGASQSEYQREEGLETHAYQFIHNKIPNKINNMKFDVIIGNPPYQLSDSGGSGTSAIPIYQKFIQQAKKLDPRFLCMITPSRWFSGGKGLDEFRDEMLHDDRMRQIHDFIDASECFPGVQIKGGVSYFLWDRDNRGDCLVITHHGGNVNKSVERPLLEKGNDIFIRYNEAIPIYHKVSSLKEVTMESIISTRRPFGLSSNFRGKTKSVPSSIKIFQNGGFGYVIQKDITANQDFINKWKIFIPFLGSGSDSFPHTILGKPFVGEPGTACTETYLVVGPFKSRKECENVISYISTRFFRFFVLLRKPSQNATRKVYSFVPMQDFSETWTDEKLYKKYKLTKEEIEFIESMIRPM